MLKCFSIDLVSRISSERKVTKNAGTSKFEYSEDPLGDVLRTSWGCPESISQGRPLNVRFGRPLDGISGRPQGRPGGGQIGSLGDVLRDVGGGRPRDVLGTNICRLGVVSNCIMLI